MYLGTSIENFETTKYSFQKEYEYHKFFFSKFVRKALRSKLKITSTSGLLPKTQYNSNKEGLEKKIKHVVKKIHNMSGVVKKTSLKLQRRMLRYLVLQV